MGIWVVTDSDYDNTWIVAAYSSQELAEEHVTKMGGYAEEVEVRATLHPDVTDHEKIAEREAEATKAKQSWASYLNQMQENRRLVEAHLPRPPHMSLCHCQTFSEKPMWTDHGYCSYCGGWAPKVYVQHMGEAAMHGEIDKLALHDREKMRMLAHRLRTETTETN